MHQPDKIERCNGEALILWFRDIDEKFRKPISEKNNKKITSDPSGTCQRNENLKEVYDEARTVFRTTPL